MISCPFNLNLLDLEVMWSPIATQYTHICSTLYVLRVFILLIAWLNSINEFRDMIPFESMLRSDEVVIYFFFVFLYLLFCVTNALWYRSKCKDYHCTHWFHWFIWKKEKEKKKKRLKKRLQRSLSMCLINEFQIKTNSILYSIILIAYKSISKSDWNQFQ